MNQESITLSRYNDALKVYKESGKYLDQIYRGGEISGVSGNIISTIIINGIKLVSAWYNKYPNGILSDISPESIDSDEKLFLQFKQDILNLWNSTLQQKEEILREQENNLNNERANLNNAGENQNVLEERERELQAARKALEEANKL